MISVNIIEAMLFTEFRAVVCQLVAKKEREQRKSRWEGKEKRKGQRRELKKKQREN